MIKIKNDQNDKRNCQVNHCYITVPVSPVCLRTYFIKRVCENQSELPHEFLNGHNNNNKYHIEQNGEMASQESSSSSLGPPGGVSPWVTWQTWLFWRVVTPKGWEPLNETIHEELFIPLCVITHTHQKVFISLSYSSSSSFSSIWRLSVFLTSRDKSSLPPVFWLNRSCST